MKKEQKVSPKGSKRLVGLERNFPKEPRSYSEHALREWSESGVRKPPSSLDEWVEPPTPKSEGEW